jgi:glucose/arabinose dehydrogenase
MGAVVVLTGCGAGGNGGASAMTAGTPISLAAPTASMKTLEVPASLAQPPFDAAKALGIPPGFGIRLWARVDGARFMALAPNGDVLVSNPDSGKIILLRERANDVPQSFEFATGLRKPHDIAFHQIENIT